MRASLLISSLVLALSGAAFLAGCSTPPAIATPTVAKDIVSEEVPYQRARDRSYVDYFADLRHRLDRLDKRLDVMQEDISELQGKSAPPRPAPVTAPVINSAAKPADAPISLTPVKREAIQQKLLPAKTAAKTAAATPVQSPQAKQVRETVVRTVPASKPAVPVAAATGAAAGAIATAPKAAQGGPLAVHAIRISEDATKTRIVFDTNAKARIVTDLDNTEKLLVITIPGAKWNAAVKQSFASLKRVSAYEATQSGADTQLIFSLRGSVTLGGSESLPPSGNLGYRAYLDLKSAL